MCHSLGSIEVCVTVRFGVLYELTTGFIMAIFFLFLPMGKGEWSSLGSLGFRCINLFKSIVYNVKDTLVA